MFYIVALGNPGDKYTNTRHNVGWLATDYFLQKNSLPSLVGSKALSGRMTEGVVGGKEVIVLFPDTFMNNSGSAVVKLVPVKEVESLVVIHDDIDLPLGEVKVGKGRGAGGHNGVNSIIKKLDSRDFVRVRIGVAPKSIWTGKTKRPAGGGPLECFVLKNFSGLEAKKLPDIFKRVNTALELVLTEGVEKAMNKIN